MNKLKDVHLETTGLIDSDTARRIGQMLDVLYHLRQRGKCQRQQYGNANPDKH